MTFGGTTRIVKRMSSSQRRSTRHTAGVQVQQSPSPSPSKKKPTVLRKKKSTTGEQIDVVIIPGEDDKDDNNEGEPHGSNLNLHPVHTSTNTIDLAQLLAQQQQQIQLLTQLARLNGHQASNGVPSTRLVEVRLRNIAAFKGETGDALEAWVASLDLQYDDYVTARGATESVFVAAAAGTLAEAAVVWWQSIASVDRPKTWSSMQTAVCKQFQSVTNSSRARDALMELKQSSKQSVVEYSTSFRNLRTRAGKDFSTAAMQQFLIERFIKGLHSNEIRRDLIKAEVTSLDEAIALSSRVDGFNSQASLSDRISNAEMDSVSSVILARLSAMEQKLDSNSSGNQQYDSRRDRSVNKRFTPAWQQIPGMTKELVEKRRAANQCFYCGSNAHLVRDCADRVNKKPARLN